MEKSRVMGYILCRQKSVFRQDGTPRPAFNGVHRGRFEKSGLIAEARKDGRREIIL
jgi:hypothetical protein